MNDGGDADEPSAEWTSGMGEDEGAASLVAAITVSGRHAFLVGYQPDEALRPSLAFLPLSFRSLCHPSTPLSLFLLSLSSSFEISFSSHVVASRAGGKREFIDGTLYLYARLSTLA